MTRETEQERVLRERKRAAFEEAAERYDATRSGYPDELISRLVENAQLIAGSRVLEVGCGTGQLARSLVGRGVNIIAIDPAPSMIAVAQHRLSSDSVEFRITNFEAFEATDSAFDLIVSATAFHWVDPRIAWTKSARLLRPGGWLALLSTGEEYDAPVGEKVLELYRRNTSGSEWAEKLSEEEAALQEQSLDICERWSGKPCPEQGLFGPAESTKHSSRRNMPTDSVVDLELTRATSLSWDLSKREAFIRDLREILRSSTAGV